MNFARYPSVCSAERQQFTPVNLMFHITWRSLGSTSMQMMARGQNGFNVVIKTEMKKKDEDPHLKQLPRCLRNRGRVWKLPSSRDVKNPSSIKRLEEEKKKINKTKIETRNDNIVQLQLKHLKTNKRPHNHDVKKRPRFGFLTVAFWADHTRWQLTIANKVN